MSNGVPYSGNRPIRTPFETIYSSNLTPDTETGIGLWTAKDFYLAMHQGKSKNGQYLYPAFPSHIIPKCPEKTLMQYIFISNLCLHIKM